MKYLKTFETYSINEEEEVLGKVRKFFTGHETSEEKEQAKKKFQQALEAIEKEISAKPEDYNYKYVYPEGHAKAGQVINPKGLPWEDETVEGKLVKGKKTHLLEDAKDNNYRGTLETGYWGARAMSVKYVPGHSEFQKVTMGSSTQTVGT